MLLALALTVALADEPSTNRERQLPQLPDPVFSLVRLPCGLPYECTDAVRFRNAEVRWKLSFDPHRPALYDIVHWRVAFYGRAGQGGPREFVAQITRPEGRTPHYRILRRVQVRDWKRAWLGRKWSWRELKRPSPAYRDAALELVRVFMAANKLRDGAASESLQF
jgi:hypothetical protein